MDTAKILKGRQAGIFPRNIEVRVTGKVLGNYENTIYVGVNSMQFLIPKEETQPITSSSQYEEIYDIEFSDDEDDQNTTLPSSVPPSEPPVKKLKVGNGFNITDDVSSLQGSFKVTGIYPIDFDDILIKQHKKILGYRPITIFLNDGTNHGSVTLTSEDVQRILEKFQTITDYSLELKLRNLIGKAKWLVPLLVTSKSGKIVVACFYIGLFFNIHCFYGLITP